MKFIIWGAGMRGKRLCNNLGDLVVAFIDNDINKIGNSIDGCPVISFEKYKEKYDQFYIIISLRRYDAVVRFLQKNKIHRFFILNDCSTEIQHMEQGKRWYEIPVKFNEDEYNVVYGLTLTSILWYDYLVQKKCKYVGLVPHEKVNPLLVECIQKDFPQYNIVPLSELRQVQKIFLTVPVISIGIDVIPGWLGSIGITQKVLKKLYLMSTVVNLYDISDSFPKLHYQAKLKKFKNLHEGQRCFIIGNGPSLQMKDLQCLSRNHEISFGMNKIFVAFGDTSWRPTYYSAVDPLMYKFYSEEMRGVSAKAKFFGQVMDMEDPILEMQQDENIYRYHYQCIFGFSNDFARCAYARGTVAYVCLQLAIYMGFSEIILVGMDFDYTSREGHVMAHFSDKYTAKEEEAGLIDSKSIEKAFDYEDALFEYKMAELYADKHGVKIYNATRGGKLEVFTRICFDDLFKE